MDFLTIYVTFAIIKYKKQKNMNQFKKVLLSAFATVAIFGTTLVSCTSDPCDPKTIVCANGGTCLDGACQCASGFEGTKCETLSRAKFIGVYNCSDACTTGAGTYVNTIAASSDSLKITFSNMSGLSTALGTPTSVYATVSGNTFTIPSQAVIGSATTTISGSGTIAGSIVTTSYSVKVGTVTDACTGTWTKQ
jgi:EGF-like domain